MSKAALHQKEVQINRRDYPLKGVVSYFSFLLIVWGFYRLMFQLPEEVEETIIVENGTLSDLRKIPDVQIGVKK